MQLADELLREAIAGIRNGIVYGVKIRLPHAFLMTLLFAPAGQSWQQSLRAIVGLAGEHAVALAKYAALFRVLFALLKRYSKHQNAAAIAGALGAGVVFREPSTINSQIVLYLTGRVLQGVARKLLVNVSGKSLFAVQSVVTWALVMWLWADAEKGRFLPASLSSSMDFLYLQ